MKVIYHDITGRHIAVLAAAEHLQLIKEKLSLVDLQQLPYFLSTKPPGTLLYMGLDFQGNEVYVLGRKGSFSIIRNAYLGLDRIFQLNQDYIFADVEPLANLSLKFFDLINPTTKKNQYHFLQGLFHGLNKVRPDIQRIVAEVKNQLQGRNEVR